MNRSQIVIVLSALALLAGCAQQTVKPPPPQPTEPRVQQPPKPPEPPVQTGPTAAERAEMERQRLLSQGLVYFDFDRSEIRPEFAAMLRAHAEQLAANRGMMVRLEGHADERGSREYNIGLGERRAQAVRRALLLGGASESQLTTVSYGEERPAALGHSEAAWGQNRRVELAYKR